MSRQETDPRILALCAQVTAKRARTVIDHIIEHGFISTDDLQSLYGYDHPPRAARDVRDNGIPLETFKVKSARTGRMVAAYKFGDVDQIKAGRVGGRHAFSKQFRNALLEKYDQRDGITGQRLDARYLQIDHRIPYEVVGDEDHDETNLDAYMLLDASSQRAKSWSCEHCPNWLEDQDPNVCRKCYWASPEQYDHIATKSVRRVDVVWTGDEIAAFDKLRTLADAQDVSLTEFIKRLITKEVT